MRKNICYWVRFCAWDFTRVLLSQNRLKDYLNKKVNENKLQTYPVGQHIKYYGVLKPSIKMAIVFFAFVTRTR